VVYFQDQGEFLVGVCEGRIVAMGAFRRTTNERAEIKRMRVHADFQGRGFGQMILEALETQAAVLGYSVLHLDSC
jgi:GNAT superfamily N-acetyltransferase